MHIFYSFIFVYSQAGEKENRSKDEAGNDVSEIVKNENKIIASCRETRVPMVGAYFDLESGVGFGDQIQIQIKSKGKTKQTKTRLVASLSQAIRCEQNSKSTKFLLFRGGKE